MTRHPWNMIQDSLRKRTSVQIVTVLAGLISLMITVYGGQTKPNGALEKLDFLVGEWKAEGTLLPGKFGAGGPVSGVTRYRWGVGKAWLVFDSSFPMGDRNSYEVHGLVAFDQKNGHYASYAFNNVAPQGIEYRGEWKNEHELIFTSIPRRNGDRLARVSYLKLADGKVRLTSQESADGLVFQTYFTAILSR